MIYKILEAVLLGRRQAAEFEPIAKPVGRAIHEVGGIHLPVVKIADDIDSSRREQDKDDRRIIHVVDAITAAVG